MTTRASTRLAIGLLIATGIGTGCSSHPPKVDCDKHLQPINAPAPKVNDDSALKQRAAVPSGESVP